MKTIEVPRQYVAETEITETESCRDTEECISDKKRKDRKSGDRMMRDVQRQKGAETKRCRDIL